MPTADYHVVLIGTGMVESICAAALSRIGVRVTHCDPALAYGGSMAPLPSDLMSTDSDSKDSTHCWHPNADRKALTASRHSFQLERQARLIFADGEFVRLLQQSKCYRYLDFSLIRSLLMQLPFEQQQDSTGHRQTESVQIRVPLSKEDVFMERRIGLADKRLLMKFITSVQSKVNDSKEEEDRGQRTLRQEMESQGFGTASEMLMRLVENALAFNPHSAQPLSLVEARRRIKQLASSVGKYGKSPFLLTHYGSSELCQAFCRLSAVYGGVYMLGHQCKSISVGDTGEISLELAPVDGFANEIFGIDANLIVSPVVHVRQFSGFESENAVRQKIIRATLITERSVFRPLSGSPDQNEDSILVVCAGDTESLPNPIYWLQLGQQTNHAPADYYVHHVWTLVDSAHRSKKLLEPFLSIQLDFGGAVCETKPKALFSHFFEDSVIEITNEMQDKAWKMHKIILVDDSAGLSESPLDVDWAVREARRLFDLICSKLNLSTEAEDGKALAVESVSFLPSPPDPEEEEELVDFHCPSDDNDETASNTETTIETLTSKPSAD